MTSLCWDKKLLDDDVAQESFWTQAFFSCVIVQCLKMTFLVNLEVFYVHIIHLRMKSITSLLLVRLFTNLPSIDGLGFEKSQMYTKLKCNADKKCN